MRIHKYAKYFPVLEGDEFEMLVKDIDENGQNEPVVMFNGEILDGVNRTRACEQLGITPKSVEYEGNDALKYVISSNIRRRHLDTSQRAMLATEMEPEFNVGGHGRTAVGEDNLIRDKRGWAEASEQVAKEFNVGGRTVRKAKRVKEEAPERVQDIINGRASVDAVDVELRQEQAKKRAEEKTDKIVDVAIEENKRFVAEFFKTVKQFTEDMNHTVIAIEKGKFDPSSKNMVTTKFDALREVLITIEETI